MKVETFFDKETSTLTYCVFDPKSKDAVVIDPVLNYDQIAGKISSESINILSKFIESQKLKVHYILETHVHADHWTGAARLKRNYPEAKVVIGRQIAKVRDEFSYLLPKEQKSVDQIFDLLVSESDVLKFGNHEIKVMETPGHTPCCLSYVIGSAVFVGDLLFMPDSGTGRCDFPGGDAGLMYHSITEKIYKLDNDVLVYTGHDYQPGGRSLEWCATVLEHKKSNSRLPALFSKDDFVRFRRDRDLQLNLPKLIFSSLQINLQGGSLPPADNKGRRFLRIPYLED